MVWSTSWEYILFKEMLSYTCLYIQRWRVTWALLKNDRRHLLTQVLFWTLDCCCFFNKNIILVYILFLHRLCNNHLVKWCFLWLINATIRSNAVKSWPIVANHLVRRIKLSSPETVKRWKEIVGLWSPQSNSVNLVDDRRLIMSPGYTPIPLTIHTRMAGSWRLHFHPFTTTIGRCAEQCFCWSLQYDKKIWKFKCFIAYMFLIFTGASVRDARHPW